MSFVRKIYFAFPATCFVKVCLGSYISRTRRNLAALSAP